jgi:hypothetical protein
VVDPLMLIETLIEISFARGRGPQHIPVVSLRVPEPIGLQKRPHKLGITSQNLIKKLIPLKGR